MVSADRGCLAVSPRPAAAPTLSVRSQHFVGHFVAHIIDQKMKQTDYTEGWTSDFGFGFWFLGFRCLKVSVCARCPSLNPKSKAKDLKSKDQKPKSKVQSPKYRIIGVRQCVSSSPGSFTFLLR